MNKLTRYTIISASVLAGGYITYLIYTRLHNAIIDAKTVSSEDSINQIKNI